MATIKRKTDLEFNTGNNNIGESFSFNAENANAGLLSEDFVFNFEESQETSANDVGSSGVENNDPGSSQAKAQENHFDNENKNNSDSTDTASESEAAAESSAASSSSSAAATSSSSSAAATTTTAGASAAGAVGTVAAVATTAVIVVVGGSMVVYGQTIEKPSIVEFEQLDADKNAINFTLLVGNDYDTINNEDFKQEECAINVELTCLSYLDFKQTIEFKSFGRLSGVFNDLMPETEYTVNVIQTSLMDLDNQFLINPITISTLSLQPTIVKPTSFVISPETTNVNVGGTTQLSIANVQPENAETAVDWTSENESIAKVDETGTVSGISSGRTTITATSKYDSTVKATATISVEDYVPNFEIVVDPFGATSVYMECDVSSDAKDNDVFEYVELTITRIDRSTGEVDTTDEMVCTLQDAAYVKQKVNFYPANFDVNGLYKVLVEGFVADAEQPAGGGDSSNPEMEGELVPLYEGQVDFATIQPSIATQDFHTNELYIRKNQKTDASGTVLDEYTSYEAYLDTADASTNGTLRAAGGTDGPYYIGFYETWASDLTFRSNDMVGQGYVEVSREVSEMSFDDSRIYAIQNYYYKYVVFTMDVETGDSFVELYRGEICFNDIAVAQSKLVDDFVLDIEIDPFGLKTLYGKLNVDPRASYDEYQITFKKLLRDTEEYDPEADTPYATISGGDAGTRQPIRTTEADLDFKCLYEITVEAFVPDATGMGDGDYVTFLVTKVDFLTVETNVLGDSTNNMYFQTCDYTDMYGNPVEALRRLDVFVGLEPEKETTNQLVIGVFTEEATSLEYNDQYMIASISVAGVNQKLENVLVEEINQGAFDYRGSYSFVLFEMVDLGTSVSYNTVYRDDVDLGMSSYCSSGIVGNGEIELEQTLMYHYMVSIDLFSPDQSSLLDSIEVNVYDTSDYELVASDLQFDQPETGHFTYYAEDTLDSFISALTNGSNKEIRISCQIEEENVDVFAFIMEPQSSSGLETYGACACFEEGEEDPDSQNGEMLVCAEVSLDESYFEKYESFILSGEIGLGEYSFSEIIDDYGDIYDAQNQRRKLIQLYDENSGSPISVFAGNLSSMYQSYTIYGVKGDGTRVLIMSEDNGMH